MSININDIYCAPSPCDAELSGNNGNIALPTAEKPVYLVVILL